MYTGQVARFSFRDSIDYSGLLTIPQNEFWLSGCPAVRLSMQQKNRPDQKICIPGHTKYLFFIPYLMTFFVRFTRVIGRLKYIIFSSHQRLTYFVVDSRPDQTKEWGWGWGWNQQQQQQQGQNQSCIVAVPVAVATRICATSEVNHTPHEYTHENREENSF